MKKMCLLTVLLASTFLTTTGVAAPLLVSSQNFRTDSSATYDYFTVSNGYYFQITGDGNTLSLTSAEQNSTVANNSHFEIYGKTAVTLTAGRSLVIETGGTFVDAGQFSLYTTHNTDSSRLFFSQSKYDSAGLPEATTINVPITISGQAYIGGTMSVLTSDNQIVYQSDYPSALYAQMIDNGFIKEYQTPGNLSVTGDVTLTGGLLSFNTNSYLKLSGSLINQLGTSTLNGDINMKLTGMTVNEGTVLNITPSAGVNNAASEQFIDGTVTNNGIISVGQSGITSVLSVSGAVSNTNKGTLIVGSGGTSKQTLKLDGILTNAGVLTVNTGSSVVGNVTHATGGTITGGGTLSALYVTTNLDFDDIFTGATQPFVTNLYVQQHASTSGNIFFQYIVGDGTFTLTANQALTQTALGISGMTVDLGGFTIQNPTKPLTLTVEGAGIHDGILAANLVIKGTGNELDTLTVNGDVTHSAGAATEISNTVTLGSGNTLTNQGALTVSGTLAGEIVHAGGTVAGSGTVTKLTLNADAAKFSSIVTQGLEIGTLNVVSGYTATYDTAASAHFSTLTGGGTVSLMKNYAGGARALTLNSGTLNLNTYTVTTSGAASISANSNLYITINGKNAGQYGRLNAGSLTVANGANLILSVKNNIWEKNQTNNLLLINAGAFTDNFTLSDSIRYRIEKTAAQGVYAITYLYSVQDIVAQSGGGQALQQEALSWDNVPFTSTATTQGKVSAAFQKLSNTDGLGKEYVKALTALAPETKPVSQLQSISLAKSAMGTVSQRISGRMSVGEAIRAEKRSQFNRRSGYRGRSGGNATLTDGLWVQGMYAQTKLDTADGFDSKTAGIAAGYDTRTEHGLLGAAYAYGDTEIDSTTGRDTNAVSHTFMVYGEYKPNGFFMNGILSGTFASYAETKKVYGIDVAADYNIATGGAQFMTGYDFKGISPLFGARYFYAYQEDYTDASGQDVSSEALQTATALAGIRIAPVLEAADRIFIIPELKVSAAYDFVQPDQNKSVVTVGGGSYTVLDTEDELEKFGWETSAGVTVDCGFIEATLRYEGRFKKNYTDHAGIVELRYNF